MRPIARIHTDLPQKFGIPRNSFLAPHLQGRIVFEPEFALPQAVAGLEEFSHLWLIWAFENGTPGGTAADIASDSAAADKSGANRSWSPMVRPPRLGGAERRGVFATRSPFRPNPLGLTCVKLDRIELTDAGPQIHVLAADLRDGTPIYDIKPYIPFADCHPDATGGWTERVPWRELEVEFPAGLRARVPEAKLPGLIEVLQQDPRRAGSKHEPERVYHLAYAALDVAFTVDGASWAWTRRKLRGAAGCALGRQVPNRSNRVPWCRGFGAAASRLRTRRGGMRLESFERVRDGARDAPRALRAGMDTVAGVEAVSQLGGDGSQIDEPRHAVLRRPEGPFAHELPHAVRIESELLESRAVRAMGPGAQKHGDGAVPARKLGGTDRRTHVRPGVRGGEMAHVLHDEELERFCLEQRGDPAARLRGGVAELGEAGSAARHGGDLGARQRGEQVGHAVGGGQAVADHEDARALAAQSRTFHGLLPHPAPYRIEFGRGVSSWPRGR